MRAHVSSTLDASSSHVAGLYVPTETVGSAGHVTSARVNYLISRLDDFYLGKLLK